MTDGERIAVIKVRLRMLGMHSSWIEIVLRNNSLDTIENWLPEREEKGDMPTEWAHFMNPRKF